MFGTNGIAGFFLAPANVGNMVPKNGPMTNTDTDEEPVGLNALLVSLPAMKGLSKYVV